MISRSTAERDAVWLRLGLAFIWLATGLGVLHPRYQKIGQEYLTYFHLPAHLMVTTCIFEILLGLRVLLGRTNTWLMALQGTMIVAFTILLGWIEPKLLYDPKGVLTKNVPLLVLVVTQWLLEREGWTPRVLWLLRGGMASIWLLEGLLPATIFQQQELRDLLTYFGLGFGNPALVLGVTGALQALSAVLALLLWGWPLRLVLVAHALGLVAICILVTASAPWAWVHPFGPVTKNIPILVGTLVVLRQVSRSKGNGATT
jgi:DoxX-like family